MVNSVKTFWHNMQLQKQVGSYALKVSCGVMQNLCCYVYACLAVMLFALVGYNYN